MARTIDVLASSFEPFSAATFERMLRRAGDTAFWGDIADIDVVSGCYPDDAVGAYAKLTLEDGVNAEAMEIEAEWFFGNLEDPCDIAVTVTLRPTAAELGAALDELQKERATE